MLKKLFRWIFRDELENLNSKINKVDYLEENLQNLLSNIDVGVDIHEFDHRYSPSWAVISIQGQKQDFIKFMNLGSSDIREIERFLRHFEKNVKIDATPQTTNFIKFERKGRGLK
jgi:hypothetical protein